MKLHTIVIITVFVAALMLLAFFWGYGLKDRREIGHPPVNSPVAVEVSAQPNSSEDHAPNLLDVLSLPYQKRDTYIRSFANQKTISSSTDSLGEYKVATLKYMFNPEAPLFNSQFLRREQNDYDKKILFPAYQAPSYSKLTEADLKGYPYLEHYMVLRFNTNLSVKIGQNNEENFDSLAVYIFNNEVYIALYQGDTYTSGYKVQESNFKDLIVESESFITRFKDISCSRTPDC